MKNILNKIFIALSVSVIMFTASCAKVNPVNPDEVLLEVNASNLHGNWQLTSVNGAALEEGTYFYINFNRSGNEYTIWETLTSIPSSPNVDEGTFQFYVDPELGTYIRGIDNVKEEWSDLYVIKELTKNSMIWVGVNNPEFIQTFTRVNEIPVKK